MNLFGCQDVAASLVDDAFVFTTQTLAEPLVVPAYVAIQTGTTRVLACGDEARAMLGREPGNITVARVLVEGSIATAEYGTALFRYGLRKVLSGVRVFRPRIVVACRRDGGDPATRIIRDTAIAGGARDVFLMEMGMATAVGMQLDVQKPEIKAVLSISDDWFEFSVISLAGVLTAVNGAIGSRSFVEDIQNHVTLTRQFRPESSVLEQQLLSGGIDPERALDVPGWESWAGRSEQGRFVAQPVAGEDLRIGMMPSLVRLTERIKGAIRTLPSDKQHLLNRTTLHAAGTAMAIPGLAHTIAAQLGHTVTPFASPVHPSIEGCRTVVGELGFLSRSSRAKP